jgi:hypothetical protein
MPIQFTYIVQCIVHVPVAWLSVRRRQILGKVRFRTFLFVIQVLMLNCEAEVLENRFRKTDV